MSNTVVRVTQLTQTTAVSNTDLFVVVRGVGSYPTTNSVSFSTLRNNLISNVSISIIPSTNATYTLGNATNQWTNLYISNTIFINNTPLTINANGALVVNGVITTTDRLVSNGYTNILYPNGSFVTVGDIAVPTGKSLRIGNASMQSTDGQLEINNDVVPFANNTINLGSTDKRWKEVWVGPGSVFIADANTANPDVELAANNNLFTIVGAAGLQVGEFTLVDNTILLANNERDVIVGTANSTGYWQLNRPMKVVSANTGVVTFDVSREGRVKIIPPIIAANDVGAFSIIGSANAAYQGVVNAGGMLHITGNDGVVSRITNDAFGTAAFPAFISRSGRGTAAAPTAIQSGDILSRYSTVGWGATGFTTAPAPTNIEVHAREAFTDSAQGSEYRFYTAPIGSITKTLSFKISTDGITFADNTVQNTAFNSTAAVTKITVGTGLTQSGNTGNVSINATGVLTVAGTNNQVIVANSGQNITLSLPQNLNTNASVTFGSITVNTITITGSSTTANTLSVTDKQIHLAPNSASSAQIDGGGFTLGNTDAAYTRSFLYDLTNDRWDTNGAGLKTLQLTAANIAGNSASFNLDMHVGNAYAGYDFPNATIQADCNNPGYNQVVAKNHSNSTDASTDYVVTNDIGDDSANYLDLGINSSTYTNADYSITGSNDGYLYINGGNLAIGTQTVGKQLVFFVGGTLANNKIGSANTSGWYLDRLTVTNTINGTANSSNYIGTLAAANVVSTTMLSSNLANYVTLAGLSANITTLNANSATYVGNSSGTISNIVSWISGNSSTAYANATAYTDTKANAAYTNAVSYAAGIAAVAYSNATSYADTKAGTAYSNAISYAATIAGTAYSNAIATAATDAASKAATAYSNAVATAASDATTKAGTAYTNAVSQATTLAATAYSNAIGTASLDATTKAGTAYANAVNIAATDATTKANSAYSNAVAIATTLSSAAYSNAVANAAALYLPLTGVSNVTGNVTFSGTMFVNQISANGSVGTYGQILTSTGTDTYWSNNIPSTDVFVLAANSTLLNQSALQPALGVGVTLSSTTRYKYRFIATVFKSSTLNTVALTYALGGNATLARHFFMVNPCDSSNQETPTATLQMSANRTANFNVATTITGTNSGSTYYSIIVDGVIDVTTGGTVIPEIGFGGTPGSSSNIQAGASFEIWPLSSTGSNTVIGAWA